MYSIIVTVISTLMTYLQTLQQPRLVILPHVIHDCQNMKIRVEDYEYDNTPDRNIDVGTTTNNRPP